MNTTEDYYPCYGFDFAPVTVVLTYFCSLCSLKEQKQSTALFREQEAPRWQSFIAVVDGTRLTPVRENVDKVHPRDSC